MNIGYISWRHKCGFNLSRPYRSFQTSSFCDYKKVKVKAGNGGDGFVSLTSVFNGPKNLNLARVVHGQRNVADGGDGGNGGHVLFKVNSTAMWLSFVQF